MIYLHKNSSTTIYDAASHFLIDTLRLYLNTSQKILLLLSGGSAINLYADLAQFLENFPLSQNLLSIAQVDERFQPLQFTDNSKQITGETHKKLISSNIINAVEIGKTGLWNVCKDRKIPYFLISQEKTLIESAKEYNQVIEKLFKQYIYKLAVLGIGEDGHTAGLAPGHKSSWQKEELVVGYRNEGKFPQRITLTPNALLQLDQAIVVVSGKRKKQIVSTILDKRNLSLTNKYPAVILHSIPKVDLFVDFG